MFIGDTFQSLFHSCRLSNISFLFLAQQEIIMSVSQSKSRTRGSAAASTPAAPDQSQVSTSSDRGSPILRPSSPTSNILYTRQEEKKNLQHLNDRFASYIEKQRRLELENQQLNARIVTIEEKFDHESQSVKDLYDQEIKELRAALDRVTSDEAKLRMEKDKIDAQYREAIQKIKARDKEFSSLENRLSGVESELSNVRHQLNEEMNRKLRLEEDLKDLRKELNAKKQEIDVAQKQLENETLARIDAENKMKSLKEELTLKKSVYEEELINAKSMRSIEVEERVSSLQQEYEDRMAQELQLIRTDHDEMVRNYRTDLESKYERQLDALKSQLDKKTSAEGVVRAEVQRLSSERDALSSQVSHLDNTIKSLEGKIKDLEGLLSQERSWNASAMSEKDKQINGLQAQIQQQMDEYKELHDVKVGLDMEIDTYRKLLEGEENRLSMSPSSKSFNTSGRFSSPGVSRSAKRKIFTEETYEYDVHTDVKSNGDVEISDHDAEGNYVQLRNKSDSNEIPIGGWQLVRKAGSRTMNYKFHRTTILKPGSLVTVWSSGSNKTHNPPADLLMKTQKWHVAQEMTTTLLDSNNTVSLECLLVLFYT